MHVCMGLIDLETAAESIDMYIIWNAESVL